ncbi:hypothetical protein H6F77_21995 [Microcoleus sp. FACHB-831]|uniref:hypothetical protein n=1 Tax=Microcoleus sp. FACHB-831 TaxID=2692827 RepID=UPI001681D61E|nr:hypothetical protein [Microcoleus sp. FACHB-831]MBD1923719.1 hypothetical protein [Microcoleus sp. FACHB-831]
MRHDSRNFSSLSNNSLWGGGKRLKLADLSRTAFTCLYRTAYFTASNIAKEGDRVSPMLDKKPPMWLKYGVDREDNLATIEDVASDKT